MNSSHAEIHNNIVKNKMKKKTISYRIFFMHNVGEYKSSLLRSKWKKVETMVDSRYLNGNEIKNIFHYFTNELNICVFKKKMDHKLAQTFCVARPK